MRNQRPKNEHGSEADGACRERPSLLPGQPTEPEKQQAEFGAQLAFFKVFLHWMQDKPLVQTGCSSFVFFFFPRLHPELKTPLAEELEKKNK